jgi:hypothetical protein
MRYTMTTFREAVVSLAVLLLATAPLALAQGSYTQIDVPGESNTAVLGIDTAGDLAGYYVDASGNLDGFLFSGGAYTTIDYPGSTITELTGINDNGQIVGNPAGTGFLYDIATQSFTTLNRQGANGTIPYAINNAAVIGGWLTHGIFTVGFELVGSSYKIISPPRTTSSFVTGISASGKLFGVAGTRNAEFDFSFSQGQYSQFAIPNASGAQLAGVNPAGTALVGYYNPSSGGTAGFIYQNKTLTTLQFPGSIFTEAVGINAACEVVGFFEDASGFVHGFTWTPPAPAEKK